MNDKVEFYHGDDGDLLCTVRTSIVPRKGATVCIAKTFYVVQKVSYAVDDSQIPFQEKMVAAVWLGAPR